MEISDGLLGPLLLARSAIDRSAGLRGDEAWLEQAWAAEKTRVLLVHEGQTLIRRFTDGAALVLMAPAEAPEGPRYLLGVDDDGVPYFAVRAPLPPGEAAGLRNAAVLLDDRDAGLLVYAVALEAWHASHEHCPRCGTRTEITASGHMRVCPRDGSQHFPRVDPAVIMLIHDDDDRVLLARGPEWPEGRMSVLAGFVEPGESLEHAVVREVLEEVGIAVTAPRYMGSQPWPFPRSLMLGFVARAATTELRPDHEEIAEARWLSREELTAQVESGALRLPGQVSIARRLIETWYGGPIADLDG
ncbi:NAD(+) diphosphatase [Microbispora sp. ATCC PTA-5024]|uniref:NAD(+) diphosphatase n=1 Tax=Microbispora sp. ATCC PTA-5024 TaxID=316330 RepID=UPI0003DD3DA1|nr:NAD(+) diphosphatase [Microbispora sp. ATCC PTA-5024]ETK31262.1 NUDIX hydrolase [Microbispora sp. ATCC PTA-5024]